MEHNDDIISLFSCNVMGESSKLFIINRNRTDEIVYAVSWLDVVDYVKSHPGYPVEIKPIDATFIPRRLNVMSEGNVVNVVRTGDYKYEVADDFSEKETDQYGYTIQPYDFVRVSGSAETYEIQFIHRGRLFLLGNDGSEIEVLPSQVWKEI